MTTTNKVHVFQAAGLGIAPFKYTHMTENRGPIHYPDGTSVGAPGQPMGSCNYCGTGIVYEFHIVSSDGRKFIVGSECVYKTTDAGLIRVVKDEVAKMKKEAQWKRITEMQDRLKNDADLCQFLSTKAHPKPFKEGLTFLMYAQWMMKHAGMSGMVRVCSLIDKLEKTK
jgi:hypothetical protein